MQPDQTHRADAVALAFSKARLCVAAARAARGRRQPQLVRAHLDNAAAWRAEACRLRATEATP